MTGKKFVLFDVDGTLVDAVANQRRVWHEWAGRYGLDGDEVYAVALRTRPVETFAAVAPAEDPAECLALPHALEDEDVRTGTYTAFDGAAGLLGALPADRWALVTSNYEHRVRGRFGRTGLLPGLIVDAASVAEGKPSPVPYPHRHREAGRGPGGLPGDRGRTLGRTGGPRRRHDGLDGQHPDPTPGIPPPLPDPVGGGTARPGGARGLSGTTSIGLL